jgi:pilus assembly protein CpaC
MDKRRIIMFGLVLAVAVWMLADLLLPRLGLVGGPNPAGPLYGIAARDMSAGYRIKSEDVEPLPESKQPKAGPDGQPAPRDEPAAVGRVLSRSVARGEEIRQGDLVPRATGERIAKQLPPGYRAITVTLRENVPTVALYPGATVDVLSTIETGAAPGMPRDSVTRLLVQRAKVLAVNDDTGSARQGTVEGARPGARRPSVTLAVTPEQAAQIEFASAKGSIGVVLRAESDESISAEELVVNRPQPAEPPAPAAGAPAQSVAAAPAPAPAPEPAPAPVGPPPLDTEALKAGLSDLLAASIDVQEIGGVVAVKGRLPNVAAGERLKAFMDATELKWVDLTKVAGLQQVQLRVRIAEASRVALRQLSVTAVAGGNTVFGGVQAPTSNGTPFQQVSIAPRLGAPVNNADFTFRNTPVSTATTLFGGVTGADLAIYLQALTENRYIRLLAEPNLVAVSGETATFLVGGEFPIPIVQGSVVGGGSTVTIEYKEFGIRLNFRPEVLGEGKLRLEVAPEVSELSEIGALNQNGFTVPSLVTRRSKSTVELGNGQSFAMAGLLRTLEQATVAKVPVLGEVPVLGTLFRSVRYEQQETELVVIVTAEVVEPLDDGMSRPAPGDLHTPPTDWELFMDGQTDGAVAIGNPLARLKSLGLEGIKGPGAWRRPDQARVLAADPLPASGAEPASTEAQPAADAGTGST